MCVYFLLSSLIVNITPVKASLIGTLLHVCFKGATCWVRLATLLLHVASCWVLTPNMSQHIATRWPNACSTCCVQQCWDMLRWHVAIIWPGLHDGIPLMEVRPPYLFVPQFTSPVTPFTWTFDGKRKNLPFRCFIWKNILKEQI